MDHAVIARRLFEALAVQDDLTVRELCAADLRVEQNSGPPLNLEALLSFNGAVGRVVKSFRYEDAVRGATATGFVEEHAVRGTLPDGKTFDLSVCVVADVTDGKVTSVREYFDTAAARDLIAALR